MDRIVAEGFLEIFSSKIIRDHNVAKGFVKI